MPNATLPVERASFGMSITPFTASGEIDEAAFKRHLHYMADAGNGLCIGAPNSSEGHLLSREERIRLYQIASKEFKGKVPLCGTILGPGYSKWMVQQFKDAFDNGMDTVQIYPAAPTMVNQITLKEAEHYYRTIIESTTHLVLPCNYNGAPRLFDTADGRIPVELFVKLVNDYSHVAGLVLTGDAAFLKAANSAVKGKVKVRVAGSRSLWDNLEAGGYGFLSTEQNIIPRHCALACESYHKGDKVKARELFDKIIATTMVIMAHKYPRPDKPMLEHLGFKVGKLREPYLPLEAAEQQQMLKDFDALNVRAVEGLK